MIFDLKIGCVVTPRQLSDVFQYAFMRWKLGVDYIPNSRLYAIDTRNNGKIQVTGEGCINLNHVTHFEPYKFFDHPRDETSWIVGHAQKARKDNNV